MTSRKTYISFGPTGRATFRTIYLEEDSGVKGLDDFQKPSRYSTSWNKSRNDPLSPKSPISSGKQYKGSTYEELKGECLKDKTLFQDPDFPAVDSNIFYSQKPPKSFQWMRPSEITAKFGEKPEFIVEGASRFDVKQGELGDCWLLAAVACLSQYQRLMDHVVPPDQSFSRDYAGIFRFRFWVFGRWVEVVVDDRLPTYGGKLVFLHSVTKNEFWSSLLEKAYAKLSGSYEALKGGSTSEAFEDFTGGVAEMFDLGPKAPPNLLKIMLQAIERESLMGCSIDAEPHQIDSKLSNGLVMGHAYSITGVKMIDIKTMNKEGKIPLIRMRNPWGNEAEWKGSWSDGSKEWNLISNDVKKEVGLVFEKDGEFWMTFQDFVNNFKKFELCYLSPEKFDDGTGKKKWEMVTMEGSWKKKLTAGGCRNFLDTFWTNPQFRFEVIDPDENDKDDTGTVIVALTQKGMRKKKKEGLEMLTIGYVVYALRDPNPKPLDMTFFKYNATMARSPFINLREVCCRHKLRKGHYCIVPSTFEPGEEGDFLIRLFSEKAVPSEEIDEKTGVEDVKVTPKPIPAPDAEQDDKATKAMKDAFRSIAGDDMQVDAYELQEILNTIFKKVGRFKSFLETACCFSFRKFTFEGFSADTSRSLVATKDIDASGKLGYEEFKTLWNDMRQWKMAFKNQDTDKNGTFNSFELRKALKDIGFTVSNQTLNALVMRYSHKDGKIYFDDFIHLVARLSTMFDIFKEMSDKSKGDEAKFTLDAFIQTTMYT